MGMKFGGVWADFHENIKAAEESKKTQREWLEKQNKEFRASNVQLNDALVQSERRVLELESKLQEEQQEAKTLGAIVFKRDEIVEGYQKQLQIKQEELEVLKKSLTTKDRQTTALMKEKNRLKDEVETQSKTLKKFNNLHVNKPLYQQFEIATHNEDDPTGVVTAAVPLTPADKKRHPINESSDAPEQANATAINPYADLFSDILSSSSTSCPHDQQQQAVSESSKSRKALTGANDFDLRERLHGAALSRAEDALRVSRAEVAHLKEVLGGMTNTAVQQQLRRQAALQSAATTKVPLCSDVEEVSTQSAVVCVTRHVPVSPSTKTIPVHHLVATPPHSMTRRVATLTSSDRDAGVDKRLSTGASPRKHSTPSRQRVAAAGETTEEWVSSSSSSPVTIAWGQSAEKRTRTPVKTKATTARSATPKRAIHF
eukprot:gene22061-28156_t